MSLFDKFSLRAFCHHLDATVPLGLNRFDCNDVRFLVVDIITLVFVQRHCNGCIYFVIYLIHYLKIKVEYFHVSLLVVTASL